jgi:hypothetical protein
MTELALILANQARIERKLDRLLAALPGHSDPAAGEADGYHERMLRLARINPEAAKQAARDYARANRKRRSG